MSVGTYVGWEQRYSRMGYGDGAACGGAGAEEANGTASVILECGPVTQIAGADESSCVCEILLSTPLACDAKALHAVEEALRAQGLTPEAAMELLGDDAPRGAFGFYSGVRKEL